MKPKCSYCGKYIEKMVAMSYDPETPTAMGMSPCHYCSQECADKMARKFSKDKIAKEILDNGFKLRKKNNG